MNQEEATKVVEDLFNATREFLGYAIRKSGVRGDIEKISSLVSFVVNENKMRSFFLGEFVTPTESTPNGEIRLYLDAIIDYASFLGVDYWSLLAKVLFCQIHHALTWESKGGFNFEKSEKFSSKVCKKLHKQGIISDIRIKFYMGESEKLSLVARQKWIEKWLGMGLEEAMQKLYESKVPSEDDKGNTDA